MNRITLLAVGVASGIGILHHFSAVKSLPATEARPTVAVSDSAPSDLEQLPRSAPAIIPRPLEWISPVQVATTDNARVIRTVRYDVPLQDADMPETTDLPPTIVPGDRSALGQWASGVLGTLVRKPADAASSAISTIKKETQTSALPRQETEQVAKRDPVVAPVTTPAAAPAPIVGNAIATDIPAATAANDNSEQPTDKPTFKAAEKPADLEKPAVTAAEPEDAPVTDENPTAADAGVKGATTKAPKVEQRRSPAPAATIPPIDDATPAPNTATVEKPLDLDSPTDTSPAVKAPPAISPTITLPVETSPDVSLPPALSRTLAPAIVPIAPFARPLTPELLYLSQKVHNALAMYQHERLLNTGKNACWDVMHRLVAFGAATEVLRGGPTGEPVNATGWLLWGGRCNSQPLMVLNSGRPMAMVGVGVQGHPGQFLGMLAQSRVRPESPFQLQGQRFTVQDLIEEEKLDCNVNIELTFELIAMSHYLKSDEVWTARTGEQWSVSRLVHEEIKQPIQGAACGGTHRLFGLSSAYKMRIAEGKPVNGEFLRAQKYIRSYQSYALGTIRNRDGSFSTDWLQRPADSGDLDRKMQTTGHILEWLVFSLEDSQLRDPRVVQSVDFIATQIQNYPNRAWSIGPLGHALHALAIYESRVFPQPDIEPQQQPAAASQVTIRPAPLRVAPKALVKSVPSESEVLNTLPNANSLSQQVAAPPQPKADPARSNQRPVVKRATRPTIGTPNAAAATAELDGPDIGITR